MNVISVRYFSALVVLFLVICLVGCSGAGQVNSWNASASADNSVIALYEGGYGIDSEGTLIVKSDGKNFLLHGFGVSGQLYGFGTFSADGSMTGTVQSFDKKGADNGTLSGKLSGDRLTGQISIGGESFNYSCLLRGDDKSNSPVGVFQGTVLQGTGQVKIIASADSTVTGFIRETPGGVAYWFYTGIQGDGTFQCSATSEKGVGTVSGTLTNAGATGTFDLKTPDEN